MCNQERIVWCMQYLEAISLFRREVRELFCMHEDQIRWDSCWFQLFLFPCRKKKSFHKTANRFRWFALRPPDEWICGNIKCLGIVGVFCFQTKARIEINLHMIPGDTIEDNRTSAMFKHPTNQEVEEDKFYIRETGKDTSKSWSWNHSMTSMWGYEGLQPWPPPCSLRTNCVCRYRDDWVHGPNCARGTVASWPNSRGWRSSSLSQVFSTTSRWYADLRQEQHRQHLQEGAQAP